MSWASRWRRSARPVLGNSDLPIRYGIEFQPESIERLCRQHGLVFPGAPTAD
jgi:hypothetical protein